MLEYYTTYDAIYVICICTTVSRRLQTSFVHKKFNYCYWFGTSSSWDTIGDTQVLLIGINFIDLGLK